MERTVIVRVQPDQRDCAFIDTDRAMRVSSADDDRPSLGRRSFHGVATGRGCAWRRAVSLLIVGPTQVGKTSSLVIPALLRWSDALVVTSVKIDDHHHDEGLASERGPKSKSRAGRDGGYDVEPPRGCSNPPSRVCVARDLTSGPAIVAITEF